MGYLKKVLVFIFFLCLFLPFAFFPRSESHADTSAPQGPVTTVYADDNTVIGQMYPPYDLLAAYKDNQTAITNLSYMQYMVIVPPQTNSESAYQAALPIKNFILQYLYLTGNMTATDLTTAYTNENQTYDTIAALPYFTNYALEELHEKYGKQVFQGGLQVYTTVNPTDYNNAQTIVTNDIESNVVPFGGDSAAMVISNPSNGYILAMIGGASWDISQTNMATVPRQQGSSMKPLIYIKAFELGYSPQTIVNDAPVSYGNYSPVDYTGSFLGKITIDQAINQSINVPAIKTLNTIGYQTGIDELEKEGIQLDPNIYYGLPVILGAADIPLTQMVGAYNALANGGTYAQTTPFIKITQSGTTILDNSNYKGQQIMDPNAVAMMDATLGDTALKQPMYGSTTFYYSIQGRPYGSKDGTSNGPNDVTNYEFIPQLTVGAWAGNVEQTAMHQNATGAFVVGPMVHDFIMQYIQNNNLPIVNFQTPVYPVLDAVHQSIN